MENKPKIVVAGAGAIGCFIGGLLSAAGHDVTLLVEPRIAQEIRAHGLTLTDFLGMAVNVDTDRLTLSEKTACLSQADVVLVTVKPHDAEDIAADISAHAHRKANVIDLRNSTVGDTRLAAVLSGYDLREAMVGFDVVPMGQGCFHRATHGHIMVSAGSDDLPATLSLPHLKWLETRDIIGVQWGKFLINLTDALNALSGLTLQDQLLSRPWRHLMADQWAEALSVLRAAGMRPVSITAFGVGVVPHVLRLPTTVFTRIAPSMLAMDTQARSAMAHDLSARRSTDIVALQGEVQRIGSNLGLPTPIADMVLRVMALAEIADEGVPHLPVRALRREIQS